MVNDFLFELGCEELPSKDVWPLAEALNSAFLELLAKAQIGYKTSRFFATPRRLGILVTELEEEQPKQSNSRRGPAVAAAYNAEGSPSAALLGFAKSCGVSVDALGKTKTDKGEWVVYESSIEGAKTSTLLPGLIQQALKQLPIAKPMRWGNGEIEFSRPVHWAVMLLGTEVIPCELLGVSTGRNSYGHRFHHPQAISITSPHSYESLLADAYVIVDFKRRQKIIVEQIMQLAQQYEADPIMPTSLLEEVTSIVEWPEALVAHFDSSFLDVPSEVLIAAMQSHQKCFALQKEGLLLPHFIAVANIKSSNPKQVISGNEKVVHARLSDAAFFFAQDKKHPLIHYKAATEKVIFQSKLGSLADKTSRIERLMDYLSSILELDATQAKRVTELSKCDLMTAMVVEFPELQGLMGYYYASHDGEEKAIAIALNEQYMPRFAADELPSSSLGMALSLAERLDTLVGIFAIGQKPSGVKDPFKLRRHALAVIRLLLTTPIPLRLSDLIDHALEGYKDLFSPTERACVEALKPFILERLNAYYQGQGISSDLIQAVLVRQNEWLYDLDKRLHALAAFNQLPEAVVLSAASKRVTNLLEQIKHYTPLPVNEELLAELAEKALFKQIVNIENQIKPLYAEGKYIVILQALAGLRESVDAFFDHVMVMVDNEAIKANRLSLLLRLQALLQGVADIGLLQAQ